jgi:hypothetical protein
VKLNTGDPPELEFISAAVQFPLMLPLSEFVPHPASTIATPSTTIVPSVFIKLQFLFLLASCSIFRLYFCILSSDLRIRATWRALGNPV